jgi:t-SNARE complex subunit (syntaxin)
MKNITAGEFAAMTDKERTIIVFDSLTNVEKGQQAVGQLVEELKAMINEDKIKHANIDKDVKTAQCTADEGVKIGKAAHKRIDLIIRYVAVTAIGALISLILAAVGLFITRGLSS